MRILRARLLAAAAGGGRRRGQRRAPQPGAHGRPLRADPHLQLPGEPDLRPPHRLQGLQPRPGARRRPRRRSSTRCVEADLAARLAAARADVSRRASAPTLADAAAAGCATAGVASPRARRRGAARATCSASTAAELRARRRRRRRRRRGVRRRWSPGARPASRCSTSPARPCFRYVELAVGPGRVRAAAGDRAARRLGDRRGARRGRRPSRRSSSTCAPAPARSRWPWPTRCPRRRVHAVELDRGRPRVGRAQPGRHRRRPAAGRHGRRLRRPGRHRRRGGLQPAVHPARGLGVGRAARPATTTRPLALWSGDDGLDAMRVVERRRGPAAAARRAWSASSTPTCRASPRRRSSPATGRWADVRDHHDLAGRPRFVTARLAR